MALYQPGDRVLVRPDLKAHETYFMEDYSTLNSVNSDMLEFAGCVCAISEVSPGGQYILEGDPDRWRWVDGMFAGLACECECEDFSIPDGCGSLV